MILVIAIGAFVSTMLGGLFALKFQDKLHLILGFSAGSVIGVAFFDLLPEALEAGRLYPVSTITSTIAVGYLSGLGSVCIRLRQGGKLRTQIPARPSRRCDTYDSQLYGRYRGRLGVSNQHPDRPGLLGVGLLYIVIKWLPSCGGAPKLCPRCFREVLEKALVEWSADGTEQ